MSISSKRAPEHQRRVVELRRSNAARPHRSSKLYVRQAEAPPELGVTFSESSRALFQLQLDEDISSSTRDISSSRTYKGSFSSSLHL